MNTLQPFFYFHANPGYLRISGEDRIDFIQRQTTNDIESLVPGRHLSTVLTTSSARILDVLQIFIEDDATLAAVTLPGRGAATASFLKRRIFFMDKVSLTETGESMTLVDVEGYGAESMLAQIASSLPQEGQIISALIAGFGVRIAGQTGPGGESFRILAPVESETPLKSKLAAIGLDEISPETYDSLRVAAGIAGPTGELTEDFTPLETGLEALVSSTKGCYTGQEVIARQITYDKITRRLVGVQLDSQAETGARIVVDDQNVGTITSVADAGTTGHFALAVIKRPHYEPGTKVTVESNSRKIPGFVRELPIQISN